MNASRKLTLGIELIDDPAWMGGTLYLRNLVICLSRLPANQQPRVRLLGAPDVVTRFLEEWGHLPIFDRQKPDGIMTRMARRLGWKFKSNNEIDVVYPGFGAHVHGAVTIRWIPDFQHKYLPQLFSVDEIAARDHAIGDIASQPGVVVLSSEVAAKDFSRFYPGHLAIPKVWHFCSLLDTTKPPTQDPRVKYGLSEKYLYLPNQFWAHKNHLTVLKALARLRSERGVFIPLVCTGAQSDRRNETYFAGLMKFIKDQDMIDQVRLLGLIERNDQVEVLRHATAVVQPSLFEGWSTVVEDVRATGRPIFLSDLPVHREQRPEHCTYFNPESDTQLAAALASKWGDSPAGPDLVAEENARRDMEVRILSSAHIFCDIAQRSLDISRDSPKL